MEDTLDAHGRSLRRVRRIAFRFKLTQYPRAPRRASGRALQLQVRRRLERHRRATRARARTTRFADSARVIAARKVPPRARLGPFGHPAAVLPAEAEPLDRGPDHT